VNAFSDDPDHSLHCSKAHGGSEMTDRHNAVSKAVLGGARLAGAIARQEPSKLYADAIPDGIIMNGTTTILYDVMVTGTTAPSNLAASAAAPLGAATKAEKHKVAHYKNRECAIQTAQFHAVGVESFGGIGAGTNTLIQRICAFAADNPEQTYGYTVTESQHQQLSTQDFEVQFRLYTGLPQFDSKPKDCPGCHKACPV